ncbi:MAG TPA: hypothetical protein VJ965_04775 [Anaerolineales bacterium]|nr:hypothetical protein [Anaerolineales bacterium]
MKRWQVLIVLAGMLLLAGCSSGRALPLSEVYIIPDFGFSIDYPEGWYTDTHSQEPVTWFMENAEDFRARTFQTRKVEGIVITFDHRTLIWLNKEFGLPEDPTLNDLFQVNIDEVTHMVNPTIEEVTLFGVDALRSEFYGKDDMWGISYAGFIDDEAFLLTVKAPSEEALEQFKPTLEAMLESIEPVEE